MSLAVLTTLLGVVLGACVTWTVGYMQQGTLWRRIRDIMLDRQHVGLDEEFLLCQMLAEQITKSNFKPDAIFAISPGGGMIAEWLARRHLGKWDRPIRVRSICVHNQRSSSGVPTLRPTVVDDIDGITQDLPANSRILLVNDISRGGESLRVAQEALQRKFAAESIKTAVLFRHVHSRIQPDFRVIDTEKAIHFDWKQS